jgi:PIN domain nuclease of toxin-antitoxin system
MRCLLDSHTFLWFVHGDRRLTIPAREAISSAENQVFLSIASLWEIAIKISLDKLELWKPLPDLFRELAANRIELLGIQPQHLFTLTDLPFHHRDPFDRLIIVQAMVEDMPVLSADPKFREYPVQIVW